MKRIASVLLLAMMLGSVAAHAETYASRTYGVRSDFTEYGKVISADQIDFEAEDNFGYSNGIKILIAGKGYADFVIRSPMSQIRHMIAGAKQEIARVKANGDDLFIDLNLIHCISWGATVKPHEFFDMTTEVMCRNVDFPFAFYGAKERATPPLMMFTAHAVEAGRYDRIAATDFIDDHYPFYLDLWSTYLSTF